MAPAPVAPPQAAPLPVAPPRDVDRLHSNSNRDLREGQRLVSADTSHQLVMQADGNLVCYRRGVSKSVWKSDTCNKGQGPFCFVMQEDRNAVIYGKHGAIWATNTCKCGVGPAALVMQDDGNVVLYGGNGHALWASAWKK